MPAATGAILVLGAGITGLTVAWELSKRFRNRVVVLEKNSTVGGLASTFSRDKLSFDMGSHRLHDGFDPEVDGLIRELCGPDLLRRHRRGVLFLRNRRLPYPPSAFDILFAFGLADSLRFSFDLARARLARWLGSKEAENFEDFTTSKVGKRLYEYFFKPYIMKLYGTTPRAISKEPALHRVRKFGFVAMLRELARRLLGKRSSTYLYPAQGIGQLAEVLRHRLVQNGGKLILASSIDDIRLHAREIQAVSYTSASRKETLETHLVVSTVPLDVLHNMIHLPSDENGTPAFDLQWRCLRLLYLSTRDKVAGENETYYFPEPRFPFGRVSELHKYSPSLNDDPERTVLTIEIPCSCNDTLWSMPDEWLAHECRKALCRLGILHKTAETEVFSVRLKNVYPVYDLGWRDRFERIYQRLDTITNLYMIGRTALFLHCNIDHCMLMALRLAHYLGNGHEDKNGWDKIRREFFVYRVRE